MEAQIKNMDDGVLKEKKSIDMLTSMLKVLEQLDQKQEGNILSLDFLWEEIATLEQRHPQEYVSYDLANVTLTYLIPLMKSRLSTFWRPFDSKSTDEACRLNFQRWRPVLEFHNTSINS